MTYLSTIANVAKQPRIGPRNPPRVFLRQHREQAGLTQEQLASRLGDGNTVDKSTVSRWENMVRVPNINIVAAFAEALGKPLAAMFEPPALPQLPTPPTQPPPAPVSAQAIAAEVARLLRRRRR
jgi:transcriptional regulator with XRE-family HTH domain